MTQTHGSNGMPQSVAPMVRDICRDALAIAPMYARLHSLGLEPARSGSVHTSGSANLRPDGSETGYVPELAVESDHAESRRAYARWVASEVAKAAKILARVEQGLERNVGPVGGYRQPVSIGSDAIVTVTELSISIEKQAERLKAGNE